MWGKARLAPCPRPHHPGTRAVTGPAEVSQDDGTLAQPAPVPTQPSQHGDSPMATRVLQSLLWKSLQALVLQVLPQVRMP